MSIRTQNISDISPTCKLGYATEVGDEVFPNFSSTRCPAEVLNVLQQELVGVESYIRKKEKANIDGIVRRFFRELPEGQQVVHLHDTILRAFRLFLLRRLFLSAYQ